MNRLTILTRPIPLLRLEGGALLLFALAVYRYTGASWLLFALLLLAPDLSAVGYLAGSRAGALAYNLAHTTLPAVALAAAGILTGNTFLLALAAIWLAHIGMDRLMGYGLKEADAFGHTHLGTKGQGHARTPRMNAAQGGTAT